MSRETVVWTDVVARVAERLGELALGRDRLLADEAQDRALALAPFTTAPPEDRRARARARRRDRQRRRQAQHALARRKHDHARASRHASTTSAAGRSSSAPSSSPRRAPRGRPAAARGLRPAPRPSRGRPPAARRRSPSTDRARGGADDGVPAERRAVVAGDEPARDAVGDEQAADRQAVRERLRERDRVGPDAERLQGEERPVRPTPVCTSSNASSAPSSSRELARRGDELGRRAGGRRPRLDRLEQDAAGVAVRGGARASRRRSARANATPGQERLERRALRRLAGRRERAVVRPWNEPSSATTPVLPVALRAYLIAASFASAPELQKKAWAPPKRSESRSASSAFGSVEYEVRHVPEPVELRVRGRERRGVAVAERDDGEPGAEVEVAPPVVVDEPRALAARRRSRRRARRSAAACERWRSVVTRAPPSRRCAPARRAARRGPPPRASARSRPRARPRRAARSASSAPTSGRHGAVEQEPGTSLRKRMRSAPSPTASAAAASSALTLSGPAASGATTGIRPAASASSTAGGATGPGRRRARAPAPARRAGRSRRPSAPSARGADRRAERGVHGGERLAHDLERRAASSRAGRRRSDREPAPLHLRGDLRPGAVHDADLVLAAASSRTRRRVRRDRAADLDRRRSRPVLRVDAHVVVREVGGEVRRAAGAEAEVELDPADAAVDVRLGAERRARASTCVPLKATVTRSGSSCAKPPLYGAEPAATSTRPQFASWPNSAVLTSGEVAIRRAIARASAVARGAGDLDLEQRRSRPRRRRRSARRGRRRPRPARRRTRRRRARRRSRRSRAARPCRSSSTRRRPRSG